MSEITQFQVKKSLSNIYFDRNKAGESSTRFVEAPGGQLKNKNALFISTFLTVSLMTSFVMGQTPHLDEIFPQIKLAKKKYQGEEAIRALGEKNLGDLAAHYKTTPDHLKKLFQNDKTLKMDQSGKLFYAEENLPSAATLGDGTIPNNPAANEIPEAETFKLHSKPASVVGKIYLNFAGRTVTSSVWNSNTPFVTEAYNKDGVAGFNSDELTQIRSMWLAVAEDYAAFNIDVTTEPPTNIDYTRFIEIIITPSNSWYGSSAGGICYIGSFNWNQSSDQVCFVFSALLANGTKYLQEAISHESGHAFGLNHWAKYNTTTQALIDTYASGQDNWAPIMGNSYYRAVTSWSKGEYNGAGTPSGYGVLQDDMARISGNPGVGYVADEAPSTIASQAILKRTLINGLATVNHMGIISNANDVDVYRLDVTQPGLSLVIKPAGYSPNLDFRVQLLDAGGALVIDPVSGLPALDANPASINFVSYDNAQLASGTYYLRILPSGYLNNSVADNYATGYSSYGSNGQYQVTGSYNTAGVVVAVPTQLSYSVPAASYNAGAAITPNSPSSSGGAVDSYSITPALPLGLSLNVQTGVISGTPSATQTVVSYTVTATNTSGSTSANISIQVQTVTQNYSQILVSVPSSVSRLKSISIQATPSGNFSLGTVQVYINNQLTCTFTSAVNGKTYICSKRIKDAVGSILNVTAIVTNTSGNTTTSDIKQVSVVP